MKQTEEQRTFYIETYGCQMNVAESHVLDASFLTHGFRAAVHPEDADIVILNTCSVRKTAENRIWGRIGFYKHLKQTRDLKLIITGCMAQRLGNDLIKTEPAVDLVVGTNDKTDLLHFLDVDAVDHDEYGFASSYYKQGDIASYVPIMNGCNNFCSYCIVPYVRGREVSRPYEEILREIAELETKGVREITLLGQNVNSYAYDDGTDVVRFPELLRMITKEISSIIWIRFMSSHPKDLSPELIACIKEEEAVCSHIHLPVQSGSSDILKVMNRKYTAQQYVELVEQLKQEVPGITFTADIMVGFPKERKSDHTQTLEMMERVGYIDAFMYYFNPREGTKAALMDGQLSDSIKLARLQEVIDLQKRLSAEHKQSQIGSTVLVMCDTLSKKHKDEYVGHTEHGERIVFHRVDDLNAGDMMTVTITEVIGNTYRGVLLCRGKQ